MNEKMYPLSKAEYGVYLSHMSDRQGTAYNVPFTLKFRKPFDIPALKSAVETVISNHPNLNSRFAADKKGGVCRELLKEPIEVKVITSDETDIISYVKPFDLETGPCVRAYIFDRTDSVELLIDVHNIVFDSVSEEIFVRELDAAFNGDVLASEEYNAYDFAADEKVRENSSEFEEGRKYYENLLNGLEEASIPMPDADCQKDEAKNVKYTLMYITPDEADSFAHNNRIRAC